jgi:gluconate 2-dehydrogenase gamma chain
MLGWTWFSMRFPAIARASGEARRIAAGAAPETLEFLTAAELVEVEELGALIIPTDDTPGAREAGSAYFIDRALAGFMSPLAHGFRLGLSDFGNRLRVAHPAVSSLADLDPEEGIAFVRSVEDSAFFELVWTMTVWGTFAGPEHGGNRDESGWSIIGFEDRHAWQPPFGHYDREAHGGDR